MEETTPLDFGAFQHGLQSGATEGELPAVKVWLAYGAFCSCGGWLLSAVHALRPAGYLVLLVIAVAGVAIVRPPMQIRVPRLRRFRRPLPAVYASLLLASIIAGAIYAPNNYDMLTYRLPRIYRWLAEGHWHWIHTYNQRMNYSGTGWEWMSLPLLLLAGNTRLLFLLNISAYALLPGLTFAFLRSVGVRGRVAWNWMWLLPTGLAFAMQAGGGGNDAMGVPLVMAAIVFARRAYRSGRVGDVFWSALAAALLSGAKASNLFLMLPCAIALLPAVPLLLRHRLATAAALPVVVFSSLAPLLILNHHFTGDFAGSPNDEGKLKIHNPVAGVIGNTIQIGWWNLQPPVLPGAQKLDDAAESHVPGGVRDLLAREFPRFSMHVGELPQEEGSGLGLALTLMAAVPLVLTVLRSGPHSHRQRVSVSVGSSVGRFLLSRNHPHPNYLPEADGTRVKLVRARDLWTASVLVGGGIALVVFMATLGSESAARLAMPYYPFLVAAILLLPANTMLAHSRRWQRFALVAAASVWPAMILTPSRPLFPAVRLTRALAAAHPNNPAIHRSADVYATYGARPDNLAAVRNELPADAGTVALLCSDDDSEVSFWKPKDRRVVQLCPGDSLARLASDHVRWFVADDVGLTQQNTTLAALLARTGGRVVGRQIVTSKVSQGPVVWYVIATNR